MTYVSRDRTRAHAQVLEHQHRVEVAQKDLDRLSRLAGGMPSRFHMEERLRDAKRRFEESRVVYESVHGLWFENLETRLNVLQRAGEWTLFEVLVGQHRVIGLLTETKNGRFKWEVKGEGFRAFVHRARGDEADLMLALRAAADAAFELCDLQDGTKRIETVRRVVPV